MTLAEFLEWEARQPLRYEFDGIGPVAMTGGTRAHTRIQRNLAVTVTNRLRGRPCEFLGSDFKFKVAKGNVRYPDGMIACTPGEQFEEDMARAVTGHGEVPAVRAGIPYIAQKAGLVAAPVAHMSCVGWIGTGRGRRRDR